jgi:hypothetical protein
VGVITIAAAVVACSDDFYDSGHGGLRLVSVMIRAVMVGGGPLLFWYERPWWKASTGCYGTRLLDRVRARNLGSCTTVFVKNRAPIKK